MKPEDQAAFNDALVNRCRTVVTVPQDFEAGWQAALAHRDAQPAVACSFPERDVTKPAEEQGLFRKFDVRRVDGSDAPGGKHHGCEYFVLDLDHDTHAPAALRTYAQACNETHPQLSAELSERFGPQPAVAVNEQHPGLLWALYHHQGGNSPVGQPIRAALGIGQHDRLTDEQIAKAKQWAEAAKKGVCDGLR